MLHRTNTDLAVQPHTSAHRRYGVTARKFEARVSELVNIERQVGPMRSQSLGEMSMGTSITDNCRKLVAEGRITDQDVTRMRGLYYDDGIIDPEEAEALIKANRTCDDKPAAFAEFLVEALTDFTINQEAPTGYITAENAAWLIAALGIDGKVTNKAELETLINILDKARWSPSSLIEFSLAQVKHAVIDGFGPARRDQEASSGTISDSEVELIRRMIYAFGGDGNIAVTQREAEVLFEINDALDQDNINEAWTELFVKAIANLVMATSGYQVPSREEALRSEAWLEARDELSPLAMAKAIATAGLDGVIGAYTEQSPEERAIERLERQRLAIVTDEEITENEATWLAERLCRDGQLTHGELALLSYLREHSHRVHHALNDVVERMGAAA